MENLLQIMGNTVIFIQITVGYKYFFLIAFDI